MGAQEYLAYLAVFLTPEPGTRDWPHPKKGKSGWAGASQRQVGGVAGQNESLTSQARQGEESILAKGQDRPPTNMQSHSCSCNCHKP